MADDPPILIAALLYSNRGWATFPCFGINTAGHCTCKDGASCTRPGKHPRTPRGHLDATLDAEQLRAWFGQHQAGRERSNIAIATGSGSGNLVVIDLDGPEGVKQWTDVEYDIAMAERSPLVGRTVTTGSGGRHLFVWANDLARAGHTLRSAVGVWPHIDLRAEGGYVIAPPSLHASLRTYSWINTTVEIPELPLPPHPVTDKLLAGGSTAPAQSMSALPEGLDLGVLLRLTDPEASHTLHPEVRIPAGERDKTFFKLASRMRGSGYIESEAIDRLTRLLTTRTDQPSGSPFTTEDVIRKVRSAYGRYQPDPTPGNVETTWAATHATRVKAEVVTSDANPPVVAETGQGPPPPVTVPPQRDGLWDGFDGAIDTDRANAWRIVHRFGKVIRCFTSEKDRTWYGCNPNGLWVQRHFLAGDLAAQNLEPMIRREAMTTASDEARETLQKWAKRSASAGVANATERVMATDHRVSFAVPAQHYFDTDRKMLAVENGVIDLRTGEHREIVPEDYVSRSCNVAFDAQATCPRWEAFLKLVLPDDEMRHYVRLMLGMSIAGDDKEHVFMLLDGAGANGKSTLIGVIQRVLGGYAKAVPKTVFVARKDDLPPFDLVTMEGARFVTNGAELKSRDNLNDDLLKSIVSLEPLPVRKLYQGYFEMQPTATLWLHTNYLPRIADVGLGLTRRLRRIRFGVTIPKPWDPSFADKLFAEEGPGILNLLIADYRRYLEVRALGVIEPPIESVEDTLEYLEDQDPFQVFLREVLEDSGADAPERVAWEPGKGWEPTANLYMLYRDWCIEMHVEPGRESWFQKNLPFPSYRKSINNVPTRLRRVNVLYVPGSHSDGDDPTAAPHAPGHPNLAQLYQSVQHKL